MGLCAYRDVSRSRPAGAGGWESLGGCVGAREAWVNGYSVPPSVPFPTAPTVLSFTSMSALSRTVATDLLRSRFSPSCVKYTKLKQERAACVLCEVARVKLLSFLVVF